MNKPSNEQIDERLKRKETHEFVIYNTNNCKLFTVVHCEGYMISMEQFEIVESICKHGPYLGFFLSNECNQVFRIRGPYHGVKKFYIIDRTGLQILEKDRAIEGLRQQIAEMKASF